MSDNVNISQGSGTAVATHQDTSNIHHQKAIMEYEGATDPVMVSASNPFPVADKASNDGGGLPFHSHTLDTSGANISAGPARLYSFDAFNTNATTDAYVKFYNKDSGSIVPSSDTPFLGPYLIPAGTGMSIKFVKGIQFTTRLSARMVTGLANNVTISPAANDVIFNVEYKE